LLWRGVGPGKLGEALSATTARLRWEASSASARALGLSLLERVDKGEVAHDDPDREEQARGDEAHDAAPALVDVNRGGVLDPTVRALDGAAARVGAAPGFPGVVVLLSRLRVHRGWHGDALLRAARRRVLGRGEDGGMGVGERHRGRPQRAAELAGDRRADDPVVAVFVVARDPSELVGGELGGLVVVGGGLLGGGTAGKWGEAEQRCRRRRAVQVAVGEHRAGKGPLWAAVQWMQVHDERGARCAQREGEAPGHTVRVARVGEEVAGDERPGVEAGGERLDCDGHRVVVTGAERHLSHELRDLFSALLGDHRREVGVVAEEQLALLARASSPPVPPGRFRISGDPVLAGGMGEARNVSPVERERGGGLFVDGRHRGGESCVEEALQTLRGQPVGGGLPEHLFDQVVQVLDLAVAEQVQAALMLDDDPEAPSIGFSERHERRMDAAEMRRTPVVLGEGHPEQEGPHAELASSHPDREGRLDRGDLGREHRVVEDRLQACEHAQRRPTRSATASSSLRGKSPATRSPRRCEQVIPAASMNARRPIVSAITAR